MAGKNERTVDSPGIGKKEGQGGQDCVVGAPMGAGGAGMNVLPLLLDANQGARALGVSLSHFYKFMRKNMAASPVVIGTLRMWRRIDLLRIIGRPHARPQFPDDVLIDARMVAHLCSVSRSMVYKLNDQELMPEPILDGRTLRWSFQAIEEWIDAGCPKRLRKRGGEAGARNDHGKQ